MKPAPPVTTTCIRGVLPGREPSPRVEDVPGVPHHCGGIEGIVVNQRHHGVGSRELVGGQLHGRDASGELAHGDVRVARPQVGAHIGQQASDAPRWRLAAVADVALERDPKQEDPPSKDGLAPPVECRHEPAHHVVGHVIVHVVRQLDEAKALPQTPADLPGQVAGVHGQAVAPDTWPGREPEVAERLGGGGVDRLPHVDPEIVGEHGQLVDEGDVDVAEGVFEELRELGDTGAGYRHGLLHQPVVEATDDRQAGGVDPRHHLGGRHQRVRAVPGVDTFRRVAQVEVRAGGETRTLLQDRAHQLLGGTRKRRRLEHHGRAGPQEPRKGPSGTLDVRQVRHALAEGRRNGYDGHVEPVDLVEPGDRPVATRSQRSLQQVVAHVLDERVTRGQRLDPVTVNVEADDVEPHLDGPHR
jgi:hypothetical protein